MDNAGNEAGRPQWNGGASLWTARITTAEIMGTAIKVVALRVLLTTIALAALVYAGDRISIVYRIPKGREPFGSVQVQKVFTVKLKNQKKEYMFDPPQPQQCVHSLFPQLGLAPCWYLELHRTEEVDY